MSSAYTPLHRVAEINARSLPEGIDGDLQIMYADLASVDLDRAAVWPRSETFASAPSRARRLVSLGDSLIPSLTGGSSWTRTRPLIVSGRETADVVYSTGFFSVSPSSQVEARYLNYCMAGRSFLTELEAISTGVTMRGFTAEQLGRRRIRVLSLEEQTAIAEYLDRETARIDALITKKQRMIELLKERRIAVVDSTILSATGYIRPIAALATYMNGWPFKPSDFTPSGTPVIRITQLTRSSDEQDYFDGLLPERVTLRDGDLVFSWSGSLEVRRWDRGHAYLNQHLFRVLPKDGVDVNWLTHALDCASRLFAEHMHGSAMTHITQPMMKMIRIPVPEVCAQARIAAELDSALQVLQTLHNAVDRQIELLRERRQALITAAVTGELDVAGVAA